FFFGNAPDTYHVSHALSQDIFIPASATRVTVSFSLYLDNSTFFGDTSANPPLDFSSGTFNQQVRVDLVNPQAPILETRADATGTPGVLKNLFITDPSTSSFGRLTVSIDVTQFAGRVVRLRFAATNNGGKL